jgi:hypothetical protein
MLPVAPLAQKPAGLVPARQVVASELLLAESAPRLRASGVVFPAVLMMLTAAPPVALMLPVLLLTVTVPVWRFASKAVPALVVMLKELNVTGAD